MTRQHPSSARRAYRPDIDGLRAVAVLMVVAYHIGWTALPGGFVGVDVFFVISGYLIGSMIIEDVSAGRFSLMGFYERRVRRIFPALVAMLLGTSVLACLYLLPSEMRLYGRSMVAATFSLSNFYFSLNSGYFVPWAGTLPLLHTWSLAIEEQFYVVFPLLVLLLYRFRPRALWVVLLSLALASFGLSLRGALAQRSVDFYMPQTRAWELLLGVLIAWPGLAAPRGRLQREGAGLLGLVFVVASGLWLSEAMPMPGYAALMPCLGAALLILAGCWGGSLAGLGLCWSPIVFVGRISYSLYLWHWPVLVFLRLSDRFPAGRYEIVAKVGALVAMMTLATLSWRYVETPFRYGKWRPGGPRLFAMAGAAALLLATIGLGAVATSGFPGRFSPAALAVAGETAGGESPWGYYGVRTCFLDYDDSVENLNSSGCLRPDAARANYLVVGDSYAHDLRDGLAAGFPNIRFLEATGAGCVPRLKVYSRNRCGRLMTFLFGDFLPRNKPDKLILASKWESWNLPELSRVLDWAKARQLPVAVIGPIMRYDDKLPRLLAFSLENRDSGLLAAHRLDQRALDAEMRQLAREKGAEYISLLDALCDGATCLTLAQPDVPLQYDDGHPTQPGSVRIAERLRSIGAFSEDVVRAK